MRHVDNKIIRSFDSMWFSFIFATRFLNKIFILSKKRVVNILFFFQILKKMVFFFNNLDLSWLFYFIIYYRFIKVFQIFFSGSSVVLDNYFYDFSYFMQFKIMYSFNSNFLLKSRLLLDLNYKYGLNICGGTISTLFIFYSFDCITQFMEYAALSKNVPMVIYDYLPHTLKHSANWEVIIFNENYPSSVVLPNIGNRGFYILAKEYCDELSGDEDLVYDSFYNPLISPEFKGGFRRKWKRVSKVRRQKKINSSLQGSKIFRKFSFTWEEHQRYWGVFEKRLQYYEKYKTRFKNKRRLPGFKSYFKIRMFKNLRYRFSKALFYNLEQYLLTCEVNNRMFYFKREFVPPIKYRNFINFNSYFSYDDFFYYLNYNFFYKFDILKNLSGFDYSYLNNFYDIDYDIFKEGFSSNFVIFNSLRRTLTYLNLLTDRSNVDWHGNLAFGSKSVFYNFSQIYPYLTDYWVLQNILYTTPDQWIDLFNNTQFIDFENFYMSKHKIGIDWNVGSIVPVLNATPLTIFSYPMQHLAIIKMKEFKTEVFYWVLNIGVVTLLQQVLRRRVFLILKKNINNKLGSDVNSLVLHGLKNTNLLFKRIYFTQEFADILINTAVSKDPFPFTRWLAKNIEETEFWKHWAFISYVRFSIRDVFAALYKMYALKGLLIKFKGKIGNRGSFRKKTSLVRFGTIGKSDVYVRSDKAFALSRNFTGTIGVTVVLSY